MEGVTSITRRKLKDVKGTCALPCPIHVTNPTDMPSPGAFIRTPGDRQHVDEQAFPWDPFQGTPGHTQVCDS